MIYSNLNHPVEVRKIRLKIWKLRDELHCTVKQRLAQAKNNSSEVNLSDLKQTYQSPPAARGTEQTSRENTTSSEAKSSIARRLRPPLPQNQLANGTLALLDLNMDTLACFCEQSFLIGQTVVVEFMVPNYFFVTGEVLEWCNYNMHTQIISNTRMAFRLHIKWVYHLPGERARLRRFLSSVMPELPPSDNPEESDETPPS